MTLVKICGMREPRHAVAAADAGVDFIGVVFATSRRQVSVEQAQAISRALGTSQATAEAPPVDAARDARWFRRWARSIEALLGRKHPLLVGVSFLCLWFAVPPTDALYLYQHLAKRPPKVVAILSPRR